MARPSEPALLLLAALAGFSACDPRDPGDGAPDCRWSLTVVPVHQDPDGTYAGNAVGCTGALGYVCDHADSTGWTSYARARCGHTELSVCTDNFASGHCIVLVLSEGADTAAALLHRFSDVGDGESAPTFPEGGWVEIADWDSERIRGRVALDFTGGWLAATFDTLVP